jgi:signal transduction histidine kinase
LASETLVMRRAANESERATLASAILREARRLIGMVENVLLFSRSGSVELKPTLETVAVDALFADVVEAVELAVDDARQSIDASVEHDVAVAGDRSLLRQALVNLVDNALKYGGPGQRIRLSADRSVSGTVRLHVDDEGPGVPRSDRDRVFEPYRRLGTHQVSERTGTGLGLAVVRQIVDACGGRVWLEDAPTRGTRAVIELRAASLPVPTERAAEPV